MTRLLIGLCVSLFLTLPAFAAPGDPRFLQGTVEWPAALTGEPVIIVRGDDGRVYSADVGGARRQGSELVKVGGRVALLILEGARPHDVTAIVIGAGDAASLARALSQGGTSAAVSATVVTPAPAAPAVTAPAPPATPAPAVSTPPPAAAPPSTAPAAAAPPAAPAPAAPAASAVAAAPPPAAPAPPAAAPMPAPAVTPPTPPAPAAPAAAALAPTAGTPTPPAPPTGPIPVTPPAPAASTVVATPPAPAPAPTVIATPPAAASPAAGAPAAGPSTPAAAPAVAPAVPSPSVPTKANGPSGDRKQWARVDGKVQSVEGALLVLKADNGSIVMVDISQLNPNISQALRRGRVVSVYGYPLEQKFEAAGYIELDPSHPEPPRLRWGR